MPRRIDAKLRSRLIEAARAAAAQAYSPYSGIRVGAALLCADGSVFSGCNVENASYGLTQCAERTALTAAVAQGVRRYEAVAIWTSLAGPLMPCGACRQVLAEFAPRLWIVCAGKSGKSVSASLDELLPKAIGPADIAPPLRKHGRIRR